MPYTDPDTELLFLSFKEWALERGIAADQSLFERLGDFVHARGGFEPALSLWDRSARELGIKLPKPIAQPQPIPHGFGDLVTCQMSPSELRKKLNADPSFAEVYGRWAAGSQPESTLALDENPYKNFSAKDWKSTPAQTLARMMSNSQFRARIEHIIVNGDQSGERI